MLKDFFLTNETSSKTAPTNFGSVSERKLNG